MVDLLTRELLRKTFHLAGSLIPIVYYFLSKDITVMGLIFINAILLPIEWLRLNGKINLPDTLLRPHEGKRVAAYIYFQIAALLSIMVFDKAIAIAALLMLAIGDTASGVAGAMMKDGDVRNHNTGNRVFKPLPIMALMFAVCVLIGFALLNLPLAADMTRLPFLVYVAGAIGATLGDAVPVRILGKSVDDNFIIPLLSGIFMTAGSILFWK